MNKKVRTHSTASTPASTPMHALHQHMFASPFGYGSSLLDDHDIEFSKLAESPHARLLAQAVQIRGEAVAPQVIIIPEGESEIEVKRSLDFDGTVETLDATSFPFRSVGMFDACAFIEMLLWY